MLEEAEKRNTQIQKKLKGIEALDTQESELLLGEIEVEEITE